MKLFDWLLELFYPTRCAFCRKLTGKSGMTVCADCRRHLPYTMGDGQRQKLTFIPCCVSPLYYEGDVRESLLRYKFHGAAAYSRVYGEFMSKCIDENKISCDIITWVPLSRRRLRRRGYDQARLLAEEIAAKHGVPCLPLLKKTRNNPAQSGTGGPEKRRANVNGVYEAINGDKFKDRSVLLVDDIVTTGTTLSECARVLRASGAKRVMAATAARAKN